MSYRDLNLQNANKMTSFQDSFNTRGKSFIATNNFHTFWANDRKSTKYTYFSCRELCLAIDFLIDNIYVRFGNSVFRQIIGIPMGTNSAPLLADLFLHTFEYDFMLRTMKQDMTQAVQFSNTFRYIDDLLSVNNENFGNYISDIYPSDLELKDTTLTSNEVCYLDTRIRNGDSNTPFHLSDYDKRDDFSFPLLFQILYIILALLFYFYIASIQFYAVARARNFP